MAAAAGLMVLFMLGTVYGWSVFKTPLLKAHPSVGIMIVSNLSPIAQRQCGLDQVAAGTMVALANICNGVGSMLWGGISDRIGTRFTFMILFASQVPVFLLLFALASCYILLCFGGGFGTMPSFVAETFGPKNVGGIYGKILLAWSLAGVTGTMLLEHLMSSGPAEGAGKALRVAAALLSAGLVLAIIFRKPAPRPDGHQG